MALNPNVWRIANEADIASNASASLSAANTFTSAMKVAGPNRDVLWTITGTWAGTIVLQRSTISADAGFADVATKSWTSNQSTTNYDDGLTVDAWYRLGFNAGAYTSGTAVCTLFRPYAKQEATEGRITIVDDPTGQRGKVVKIVRNNGDALVSSGLRTEIARERFGSEYAFNTGGGWYHTSYMFGPEWLAAIASGELAYNSPPGNSKSALIKQFHPKTSDGFTHPMWCLRVSELGVTLNKNAMDDSEEVVAPKAVWPVDEMVWHDVTFGVVWKDATRGKFLCFLDGRLVYSESGPQAYPGATAGGWYSEGIYLPGAERDIATLSIYTQGFVQAYPGSTYSSAVGSEPRTTIKTATRTAADRSATLLRVGA